MKHLLTHLLPPLAVVLSAAASADGPVWPPPPDAPRVRFVEEIRLADLDRSRGILGRIAGLLGGAEEGGRLRLPCDVLVVGDRIFTTCQNLPALVEIDASKREYRLHEGEGRGLETPLALCQLGDAVLVSDPEGAAVHRLDDGGLRPWITRGLVRPTGLAASADGSLVFVVDTGDHRLKIHDAEGRPVDAADAGEAGLRYPTFATRAGDEILVNDTLNFRIKRFGSDGSLRSAFGLEGDGPGAFARPKGVAAAADGRIYVVDALFDNLQIFDPDGRVLLVVGGPGQAAGEFWSPAGIDIARDMIYVADTFNHRIQVLQYLGGGS